MLRSQYIGIIAGLLAGILWGAPFVAPLILQSYSPLEITFGRFVFFGVASLLFCPSVYSVWKKLSTKNRIQLIVLSSLGFWVYTLLLSYGVQRTNGVLASLIIGVLPLTIAVFGRPKFNVIFACGVIILVLGFYCLFSPQNISSSDLNKYSSGIVILLVALFIWTCFAIKFAKFASEVSSINSFELSSLIGVINLIFIVPIYFLFGDNVSILLTNNSLLKYLMVCFVLGFGASWLANVFWAYCSKVSSATICGALMVSETTFGCIYSLIYYNRLPNLHELLAIISLFCGMLFVVYSQRNVDIVNSLTIE